MANPYFVTINLLVKGGKMTFYIWDDQRDVD